MTPGLTCAACERPMDLSRVTDEGFVHADGCPRVCAVEGCDVERTNSKTWCEPHSRKNRRWGNPLGRPVMEIEDVEWMAETGENFEGAARRLDMTLGALAQALRRAKREDLMAALKANGGRAAA